MIFFSNSIRYPHLLLIHSLARLRSLCYSQEQEVFFMDYGFTPEEVLTVYRAVQDRKAFYEVQQNSTENRALIRDCEAILRKLETTDPNLRIWQLAKSLWPDP